MPIVFRRAFRGAAWGFPMCATGWRRASTAPPAPLSDRAMVAASGSILPCRCSAMAEKMRISIVDDDPLAVERLQILCARIPGISLVGTAMEGAGALRLIDSLSPDLVLLDIQMPGTDVMAVARALAEREQRPAVIFVTAFDQFAVAAFDVAAVDYLLKPVEIERLERAVARIRALIDDG